MDGNDGKTMTAGVKRGLIRTFDVSAVDSAECGL